MSSPDWDFPPQGSAYTNVPADRGALVLEHVQSCLCGYRDVGTEDTKILDARCIAAYRVPKQAEVS